jgi:hypothetical protein
MHVHQPQDQSFHARCIALVDRQRRRIRDDRASLEREEQALDAFERYLADTKTNGLDTSGGVGEGSFRRRVEQPGEFLRFATSVQIILENRSNASGDFSRGLVHLQETLLDSNITARR